MKKDIPVAVLVAPVLLILVVVGYFLLIKPKQDAAGRFGSEIASLQTQIDVAMAAQRQPQGGDESAIKVADVFRVTKAMPDSDDMPGIILELNSVAGASGIEFVSITPQSAAVRTGYTALPINLTFEGNYYDLTDFLFRIRNLVTVRDGKLEANGRLFTLDSLSMEEGPGGFPEIAANLTLTAYYYSTTPPAAPAAPVAPGATDTSATTTTPPEGGDAVQTP